MTTATNPARPLVAEGVDAGRPWYPGMYDDGGGAQCMTCDSHYCSDHCHAYADRVYVVSSGWRPVEWAATYAAGYLADVERAVMSGDENSERLLYNYAMNAVRWNERGRLPVA